MSVLVDVASWILIAAGGLFCVVGAIGVVRMPDVYTRMHASGVIDPFGVVLMLSGMMLQAGFTLVTAKLLFLALLLMFTSPVSCYALARAALDRGLKPLLADGAAGGQMKEDLPSKP